MCLHSVKVLAFMVPPRGQAGLATAWHLKQLGLSSLLLQARPRIGDGRRSRWDSLLLFTPARGRDAAHVAQVIAQYRVPVRSRAGTKAKS